MPSSTSQPSPSPFVEPSPERVDCVAHELRGELASIRAYGELLEDGVGGPLSEQQRRFVERIRHAERSLSRMVDNLAGSLDRGAAEPSSPGGATLEEALGALRDVVAKRRDEARARGLEVEVRAAAELPHDRSRLDLRSLREAVAPLVDNALQHAREVVLVRLEPHAEQGTVEVRVEDDGAGIPPDERPLLQSWFTRGLWPDRARGLGLGLPLSRARAIAAGGDLVIEQSSLGGLAARVSLPLPSEHDAAVTGTTASVQTASPT